MPPVRTHAAFSDRRRRLALFLACFTVALAVQEELSRPELPMIPPGSFDLAPYIDNCRLQFRFDYDDLIRLPAVLMTSSSDRVLILDALCILLYRLSYPHRWGQEAVNMFHRFALLLF